MSARCFASLAALAGLSIAWLGCASSLEFKPYCEDGPFAGTWNAPAAYAGTASDAPSGLAGSAPLALTVVAPRCFDADNQETETIVVSLGPSCVLRGTRTSTNERRSCSWNGHFETCRPIFIDATAAVGDHDAPPSCELPLGDGTLVLAVEDGTLHVTADRAIDLTLTGSLSAWNGKAETGATVTVTFASAVPAAGSTN